MDVIPAIDLRGGRCVRLIQGDYDRETAFSDDPAAVARRWAEAGAPRIHVVDLDGAREGRPMNADAVRTVIDAVDVPVQVAGGVRTLESVDAWLAAGAARVVLGTAAVRDPALAAEAARLHGERIVVSVDARDGFVAAEGWTETTGVPAEQLLRDLAARGVPRFVYTDVGRDGTRASPNYAAVAAAVEAVRPAPLIAAGGVGELTHLVRLASLGVEGVIVGIALYDGSVDLREALAAVG